MKLFFLLSSLFFLSCNHQAQEKSELPLSKPAQNEQKNTTFAKMEQQDFDIVEIDSIADIAKGANEKTPAFIKQRLELLVGRYLKKKCNEHEIAYPPKFILFRFFKMEKEFEVWAGNSRGDSLKRILFLPVCAVDAIPGTKIQQGDGKTPEGFYNSPVYYGSPADFMWIKLNNAEIDTYGSVGYGSSIKMCLDYPNALDRQRTKTLLKTKDPGSAICIHANCVSIGCISFKNTNYLPVALAALGHNSSAFGAIKIHIFPFRFDMVNENQRKKLAENVDVMKPEQVLEIWQNLEEGYNWFNKARKPMKINIVENKIYSYESYR